MSAIVPMRGVVLLTSLLAVGASGAAAQNLDREIAHLQGDLYTVREGARFTVFLVTPDGIVLVDPLSTETSLWLEAQLKSRYPDLAVRYVLHTHHHFDRAEGAAVFNATAELVGQREFAKALAAARERPPTFLTPGDEPLVEAKDRNGDGETTPQELYRRVRDIETTFDGERTISIGGKTIRLVHVRSRHAPDLAAIVFTPERVAFSVDHPPFAASSAAFVSSAHDVVQWVRAVAPLPFDTLLSGTGERVSHAEVDTLRDYVNALLGIVADGYERGLTVAAIQRTTALDAFSTSPHYAARRTHIADVYRTLSLTTADLVGVATGRYVFRSAQYCATFETCSTGGMLTAGTMAMRVMSGRVGLALELTLGAQLWSTRTSPTFDDETARRETRGSALARYAAAPGGFSWAVLAGPSVTFADVAGMSRTKRAFAPAAGRRAVEGSSRAFGFTAGVDLVHRLSRNVDLAVPIRGYRQLSSSGQPEKDQPSRLEWQGGVGLSVKLLRRIN